MDSPAESNDFLADSSDFQGILFPQGLYIYSPLRNLSVSCRVIRDLMLFTRIRLISSWILVISTGNLLISSGIVDISIRLVDYFKGSIDFQINVANFLEDDIDFLEGCIEFLKNCIQFQRDSCDVLKDSTVFIKSSVDSLQDSMDSPAEPTAFLEDPNDFQRILLSPVLVDFPKYCIKFLKESSDIFKNPISFQRILLISIRILQNFAGILVISLWIPLIFVRNLLISSASRWVFQSVSVDYFKGSIDFL